MGYNYHTTARWNPDGPMVVEVATGQTFADPGFFVTLDGWQAAKITGPQPWGITTGDETEAGVVEVESRPGSAVPVRVKAGETIAQGSYLKADAGEAVVAASADVVVYVAASAPGAGATHATAVRLPAPYTVP